MWVWGRGCLFLHKRIHYKCKSSELKRAERVKALLSLPLAYEWTELNEYLWEYTKVKGSIDQSFLFFSELPLVVKCAKITLPYLLWKAFHTFRWQITLSINNKKIYLVMKCFLCFLGHVLNYLDNHTTCMARHFSLNCTQPYSS